MNIRKFVRTATASGPLPGGADDGAGRLSPDGPRSFSIPAHSGAGSAAVPSFCASRDGGALISEIIEPVAEPGRLDDLRLLIRELTYGEMLDLAAGFRRAGGNRKITLESLPRALHRWATREGT
jgi:hypothetical protein